MTQEIFKVQTVIESNMENPPAMVYNRDRSKEFFLPVTEDLRKLMNGKPKKFFSCHIEEKNLVIDFEAPWQSW